MKAYSLQAIGDLRLLQVPEPKLDNSTVLVKVAACGICSSDIPRVFERGTYSFPTIPGHEFAGTVVKAGGPEGEGWLNTRVGVFPLIPCFSCGQCARGHYEMCSHYNYLGSRCNGGFAENVKIPIWNLIGLPANVTFEQAAMLEPAAVALHAANAALADSDTPDRAAVCGTGAIGFLCACWLKIMGCRMVTIIGRSDDKQPIADELGLSYAVLQSSEELENQFDAVIEAVGSSSSVENCLDLAAPGGRIIAIGNPQGDMHISRDLYWKLLRKQLTVKGVWNSSYESGACSEWSHVVDAMAQGYLDVLPLITHRMPFENLLDGLKLMREKSEPYCKVMVINE